MPILSFPSNPTVNDTYTFNGKTWVWNGTAWDLQKSGAINGLPIGNVTPSTGAFTTLSSTGNTSLGDINSSLIPAANAVYDLGSEARQWSNLYLTGNTIYLGGLQLKDTGENTLSVFTADGTTPANIAGEINASDIVGTIATAEYVTQNAQANITSVGTLTSLDVTGNITSGNLSGTNIFGTLATAAQTNITSIGTLGSLAVTGNIASGNTSGAIITGTSTVIGGGITLNANTISSSGSTMTIDPSAAGATGTVVIAGNLQVQGTTTTIDSTSVTINDLVFTVANNAAIASAANGGGIEVGPPDSPYATWLYDQPNSRWSTALGINATGNVTAGNLSGTSISGTLTTAAQTNITSVGTLTELAVTGNISGGNIGATNIVGTLATASQPNITTVGTLGALAVTGNITGGNISIASINATGNAQVGNILAGGYYYANGIPFTSSGGGISWTTQANVPPASPTPGDFWYDSYTQAKYQYVNDGTGNVWVDQSAPTTFATISVSGIINNNANGVGNIGSDSTRFDTVFAKATSAQYADLAEIYVADAEYPPGTVVVFGGSAEITQSTKICDSRVAGVISTNPAFIMNDSVQGLPVALVGRVPCRVKGPVLPGDVLVTSDEPGTACRIIDQWVHGCVIGKSLGIVPEGTTATIEVSVGRF